MHSRAQEAGVLKVLGDCPSGTMRTYCLEHLLAATEIPSAHAFDLVAFAQALQAKGECEARYGGFCDGEGQEPDYLLVWGPGPLAAQGALLRPPPASSPARGRTPGRGHPALHSLLPPHSPNAHH